MPNPFPMLAGLLLVISSSLTAQTTEPKEDAAKLYESADQVVAHHEAANIMSPSNSWMDNTSYPYSDEWLAMEKADFVANGRARVLARQARPVGFVEWPAHVLPKPDLTYLNHLRDLANDLGDAAVFQHLQGEDAAAVATVRDVLHMVDLLQNPAEKWYPRFLVSIGAQALAMDRLNVITSSAVLINDPANNKSLQVSTVRDLMMQLLKHGDAKTEVNDFTDADTFAEDAQINFDIARCITMANRSNTERDLAAMSLACHLYRFDTGRWPKSLDDLHRYLPVVPIDLFGDGKQVLGYVLVKGGLPDGSDRPLVYSRCNSSDGLFIRTDRPFYSFYIGDGSNLRMINQKKGGQFRDVTRWIPGKAQVTAVATTQPIN